MTPKERAAMQQALYELENDIKQNLSSYAYHEVMSNPDHPINANLTALREALDHSGEANEMVSCAYCNNPLFAGTKCNNCGFITLAEQAEPNSTFMEGYRIGLAEMREACAKVCEEEHDKSKFGVNGMHCAAAIRAIKFEGDTGFRPVSEMIAEHKQDPKKGAAIEKAKVRKAEQKPVAFQMICPRCKVDRVTTPCPRGGVIDCPMTATSQSAAPQPVKQEPVAYLCPSFVDNFATGRYETCEQKDYGAFPVYTHPVRTKDLTDDEIADIRMSIVAYEPVEWGRVFARAVIAADRGKNK